MLTILIKAYCVNVVVDIKPIYLNKRYLFQNKIYYLDKIYFCFGKIKLSKHTLFKLNWLPDLCKIIDFMQDNIKRQYNLGSSIKKVVLYIFSL